MTYVQKMAAMRAGVVGAVGVVMALGAPAMAHEGDVGPLVQDGRLVSWFVGEDESGEEGLLYAERVFGAEMESGLRIETIDPGYFGLDDSDLEGARFGVNILKSLKAWDGADFFQDATTTLTVEDVPSGFAATTPATDTLVEGPTFLVPDGGYDYHFDHILNDDQPGIYLLEIELKTDLAGVGNSLPLWYVFNYGQEESEHELAIEWVVENLVPAPGAGAVLVLGGLAMGRRRR